MPEEKVTPPNVAIGLTNPKSPTNVGAIMRASGCFQVNSIVYTGNRYNRAAKFHTDTMNAINHIPLTHVDDLLENAPEGAKVICVELVEGATPLPKFKHPENAFYIFGPEDASIKKQVLRRADEVVYIPTIGCMNLAATVNVVLYDRLAKSDLSFANDELIRNSRDVNNNATIHRITKKAGRSDEAKRK